MGLKDIVKELLAVDLSKEQQSSDWGAPDLSEKQLAYAANDVAYLHRVKEVLDRMLAREGRTALAKACFDFLPLARRARPRRVARGRHLRALKTGLNPRHRRFPHRSGMP